MTDTANNAPDTLPADHDFGQPAQPQAAAAPPTADAPDTLPADFFSKQQTQTATPQQDAPDSLPANFDFQAGKAPDDRGSIHKLWDWVNKGLVSHETIADAFHKATASGEYEDMDEKHIRPIVHIPGAGDFDLKTFQQGVIDSASGVLSSFSSPLSIATFAAGPLANSGKAVQAARAANTAKTLEASVAASEAAFSVRVGESLNAADQARAAQKDLEAAKAAYEAGTGSKQTIIAAQERASASAANAIKAQEALEAAQQAKRAQSVKSAIAARNSQKASEAAKAAGFGGKLPEMPGVAKAANLSQKVAGTAFTGIAAKEAATGRQPGESLADELERRLQAAGFAALGAHEVGENLRTSGEILKGMKEHYDANQASKESIQANENQNEAAKKFKQAIPAGTGKAAYNDNDYSVVRPFLEAHHAGLTPSSEGISDAEGVRDAIETERAGIENAVKPQVEKYKNEPLSLGKNADGSQQSITQRIAHELAPQNSVKSGFIDDGIKALEDYNLTNPTVGEADKIRKSLNDSNRAALAKNSWDVSSLLASDPAFAARFELADILRDGVYDTLESKGVTGAREMRQAETSLIKVRNAAERQINNGEKQVRGTSEASGSNFRKGAAKLTTKAGAAVGSLAHLIPIPGAGEVGAAVGAGVGEHVGKMINPPDLTRNQLIRDSFAVSGAPDTRPTLDTSKSQPAAEAPLPHPRENSPLHSELATHYGEEIGDSSYKDLEERFLSDVRIKRQHELPLETPEKALLNKINTERVKEIKQAKDAAVKESEAQRAEQVKDAEKAKAEAEAEEKTKEKTVVSKDYTPSEKAATMSADRKDYGPEFEAAQMQHEIDRNKSIARNPNATEEERSVAKQRLAELQNPELRDVTVKDISPFQDKYTVSVTDDAGQPVYHKVDAFSPKEALDSTMEEFKNSSARGQEFRIHKMEEHQPSNEYTVPTGKNIRMPRSFDSSGNPRPAAQTMIHEYGHSILAHLGDFGKAKDILSHKHPDMEGSGRAGSRNSFPVSSDGNFTRESIGNKLPELVQHLMGGIAADEVFNGIDRSENHNADPTAKGSDASQAMRLMTERLGLTPKEAHVVMHNAIDAAKEKLNHPVVRGMINENIGAREEGLHPAYHVSAERMKNITAELDRRMEQHEREQGNANGGRTGEETSQGLGEDSRVGQEGAGRPTPQEISQVAADKVLPPERSTGDAGRDSIIKEAGAVPGGTFKGFSYEKNGQTVTQPDLAMFHDPHSGTTLALPVDAVTPENIKSKLESSRDAYRVGEAVKDAAGNASNGFTFNPKTGRVPNDGYMVELFPERRTTLDHQANASDIQDSMNKNEDVFSEHPELHVGGYGNELNVSGRFADKDAAVGAAKKLDQISIWDNANKEEIPTGGKNSGVVPADYTPEKRLADLTPEHELVAKDVSDRVSTRVPEGPSATEDPMGEKRLEIGREALEAAPKLHEKLANTVSNYPGVKIPKNFKDPVKIHAAFVNHVADNLKYLWNSVPKEKREANSKWYESANKLSKGMAEKNGLSDPQAAAVIATMSPQKDWDMNVSLARRVTDTFRDQQNSIASPQAVTRAEDFMNRPDKNGQINPDPDLQKSVERMKTTPFKDLDTYDQAVWTRFHDEAHNPREFHQIDPGTGNNLDFRKNSNGSNSRVAWGSFAEIAKAISVIKDGSRANISEALGGNHKVRNFYNNIADPSNPNDVTIDTHAVAAGLLQPLGGKAKEVLDNFGKAGKNVNTGVKGTYPLYADAYRQAAGELGIKARELQSVVWEKVRDLFPSEWKSPETEKQVKGIWKKYSDGKQSLDKTREEIVQLAQEAKQGLDANAADTLAKANQKKYGKNQGVSNAHGLLDYLESQQPRGGMAVLAGGGQ